MLRHILLLRVNLAILVIGAFGIIFSIKLTSLLPSQNDFSFSKLVVGDTGPFLVNPPSVSGHRLCEILKKHLISPEQVSLGPVDCNLVREDSGDPKPREAFSQEAIDQIYATAIKSDYDLRSHLVGVAPQLNFAAMSEDELNRMLEEARTLDHAFERLKYFYNNQVRENLGQSVRRAVEKLYASLPKHPVEEGMTETLRSQLPPLSAEQRSRITAISHSMPAKLRETIGNITLVEIGKPDVEAILKTASGIRDISNGVTKHYLDQMTQGVNDRLEEAFEAAGLKRIGKQEARRKLFSELSEAGIRKYVIAVLIHLSPVLLFGVLLGFIFGRPEFLSIAAAAALAAFLLSWPLMLMWDRLVGAQWATQKPLFMVFYAFYILSFFITARLGAVFGALMRTKVVGRKEVLIATGGRSFSIEAVTWNEFGINLLTGVVINAAVYAWNIIIPMTIA